MKSLFSLVILISLSFGYSSGIITVPLTRAFPKQFNDQLNTRFLANEGFYSQQLTNYQSNQYYGNVQLGSNLQNFTMLFDSGSNSIWIPKYSCVNEGFCDKADGIFGLGVYDSFDSNSDSFVSQLFQNKMISNPMFTFHLGFESDSELIFGGFNPKKVANSSQIYFHNIILNGMKSSYQQWLLKVEYFSVGDININLFNNPKTIIDSGSSLITLNSKIFEEFQEIMILAYGAKEKNKTLIINCDYKLPDLTFSFLDSNGRNRQYSIPQSFYLFQLGNGACQIQVMSIDVNDISIILGDVFMRRYATLYSHSNNTIGLSLSVSQPYSKSNISGWIKAAVAIGGVILTAIIGGFIYKKTQKEYLSGQNQIEISQQDQVQGNQPSRSKFNAFQGQGVAIGQQSQNYIPLSNEQRSSNN